MHRYIVHPYFCLYCALYECSLYVVCMLIAVH